MSEATYRGRRVHWQADGQGQALVLIPGIGSGMKLFGTLPRRFAKLGLRCITFDPVGIPPSSPFDDQVYDFARAGDELCAVLDAAGAERAHLVGTSLGGKVGLTMAARHPSRVASLTMLGSAAVVPARAQRVYRFFEVVAGKLDGEDFGTVIAPFLIGHSFQEARPQLVDDIVRAVRPSADVRRLMVAQARGLHQFSGEALAPLWRGPTLCVAGGEDTLTLPVEVRATAELLGARYVEIADAGHSLLLESARAFDEVCRFVLGDLPKVN